MPQNFLTTQSASLGYFLVRAMQSNELDRSESHGDVATGTASPDSDADDKLDLQKLPLHGISQV
jgi:hypothetical protein